MRKVLVLLLALMILVVCSACSNKDESPKSEDSGTNDNSSTHKTIQLKVGDIFPFGRYEQDNNLDNGPEAIEWMVLDVQDGKALLLSRYGLDAKPYNEKDVGITWEKCTLRSWLNGTFQNEAFTAQEQKGILTTSVDNNDAQGFVWTTVLENAQQTTGGNNTRDRIFLLSYAEANQYLDVQSWDIDGADQNMKSRISPTAYALQAGTWTSNNFKTADGAAAGWWWLRSPGFLQSDAAYVDYDGALYSRDAYYDGGGVRPAFWLNLESDIF